MTLSRSTSPLLAFVLLALPIAVAAQPAVGQPPPRDAVPTVNPQGASVLRGRVVDLQTGQPLRRAKVTAFKEGDQRQRATMTDDQGRWELGSLPQGRYSLLAYKAGYVPLRWGQRRPRELGRQLELAERATLERVDFSLPRGSVLSGRVTDELGEPLASVNVEALQWVYRNGERKLQRASAFDKTDDRGEYRIFGLAPGDYLLVARAEDGFQFEDQRAERIGYAPTFYPGTVSGAEAQRVSVGIGGETGGLAFPLQAVRTVTVRGQVVTATGPGRSVFVVMYEGGGATPYANISGMRHTNTDGDGWFTFSDVPPGSYLVSAQVNAPLDQLFESQLAVGEQDVLDFRLFGRSATPIRGRVIVATSDGTLRPSTLFVRAEPLHKTGAAVAAKVETVHDDWTFEVGTFWNPSVLAVPGLPPGWILSSVQYAGREHVDSGLPLREGQPLGDVQLVITSRGSRVSAKVTDDKGAPVRDYTLVVYSDDAERWGPLSRYLTIARPDQKGESLTDPLPPARYLAVAVSAFEEGAEGDPAFLERLRPVATPVDLREGETHGLALALVQEP